MVGQPSRVPGYSQGLAQAPGQMALPPEPMPIGRPTAVVGGPAYFTPQGYNAPPQPTEAFMPTDRAPDPIGQQFMRQMQSPMGQQFQQQYEATQAPIREAEMAKRAEEQAAQDARFQEMMDRIAELEGQLATPTPSPVPEPEPYLPGGPFPGIPDFSNLDFSGLPDFLNFDYDDIMRQYNDRMEMGEPEPIDSFLFGQGSLPVENSMGMAGTLGGDGYGEYPLGSAGPRVDPSDPNYRLPPRDAGAMPPGPATDSIDLQAMLEDSAGRGRFYGDPMEPMMSPRYQIGAPMFNQSALDRLVAETEALNPGLKLGNPTPGPATDIDLQAMFEEGKPISKNMYPDFVPDRTTDRFNQIQAEKKANQVLQTKRSNAGTEETLGDGRIRITDRDGNVTFKENPAPAPAPVYTPPPQMSRRPMIPSFGNINLR